MKILLTGATGYVGGRLLPVLEARGHEVLCLARHPANLAAHVGPGTRVIAGDVLNQASLATALERIEVAYYLVHSLGDARGFEERETMGAQHFAAAARAAGIARIIYLGGLGEDSADLSPHLRSRHAVGHILRNSGVTTVELRASIVIGSGSVSFEIIRSLCEHLPVMITPRWVSVLAQPIAVQDLVEYLVQALDAPIDGTTIVEIGGADQLSYAGLMREYARQRHLRRLMIPVPLLTPRLSSLWLGLVTPVYARVGRKLIESIRHPTVVRSTLATRLFHVQPRNAADAIRAALQYEDQAFAESRWFDALSASGTREDVSGPPSGLRLMHRRAVEVNASPSACFETIAGLGGRDGWLAGDWLWRLRGFVDLLVGGVGMRRGRPDHRPLRVGDALDFWRVEAYEPPHRLRLSAEMRVPGRAWLEFTVEPGQRGSRITQTAEFDPIGILGRVYWYGIYPFHALLFKGLLTAIATRATRVGSR